jgi:hypothetical protein
VGIIAPRCANEGLATVGHLYDGVIILNPI